MAKSKIQKLNNEFVMMLVIKERLLPDTLKNRLTRPNIQGMRLGFEIKRTSPPRLTPSMRHAMKDLKLKTLDIIHSGEATFPIGPGMRAVALSKLLKDLKPIRT